PRGVRGPCRAVGKSFEPSSARQDLALPERSRFAIWLRFPALRNYPSEIDTDGRIFGGEHKIRPYAQKLRLHRAILLSVHFLFFMYAFHAAIRRYRKCSDRLFRSIGCDPPRWISNNNYFHKVLVRYRYRDSLSILSGFSDSE
ncbi:MAG: hypothetical protein BECKG1743F_GA0114225_107243, partial [Candidatus Kentron sp. G]